MSNYNPDHLLEQARLGVGQALNAGQQGLANARDNTRDSGQHLRDRAQHAGDSGLRYVRGEPVKSLLMAAAVGAGLMALLGLVARSRSHG